MILEKIKETRLTFSQGSVAVLLIITNYQKARVNPTNTQLKKLKSAAESKTGAVLRINKKNFQDKELPHELFLTIRQTTKIRNALANNMSTDIKLSEVKYLK